MLASVGAALSPARVAVPEQVCDIGRVAVEAMGLSASCFAVVERQRADDCRSRGRGARVIAERVPRVKTADTTEERLLEGKLLGRWNRYSSGLDVSAHRKNRCECSIY